MNDLQFGGGFIGIVIAAIVIVILLIIFLRFVPVGLWVTAYFSGVKVGIGTLIGMRLRRVNPHRIIRPLIKATKAGLSLSTNQLEA
ncbi:MAG: flotillin-like FloA family protein, partial [Tetragenococcus halophilus]|nr:flotillin-like FloA family protein [Tetragenococcus halophilus]